MGLLGWRRARVYAADVRSDASDEPSSSTAMRRPYIEEHTAVWTAKKEWPGDSLIRRFTSPNRAAAQTPGKGPERSVPALTPPGAKTQTSSDDSTKLEPAAATTVERSVLTLTMTATVVIPEAPTTGDGKARASLVRALSRHQSWPGRQPSSSEEDAMPTADDDEEGGDEATAPSISSAAGGRQRVMTRCASWPLQQQVPRQPPPCDEPEVKLERFGFRASTSEVAWLLAQFEAAHVDHDLPYDEFLWFAQAAERCPGEARRIIEALVPTQSTRLA